MNGQTAASRYGQLIRTDFADNTGGTNLSDSVFKITERQSAGGYNFDYVRTGGIRKRLGPTLINTVADTQLKTLGFGVSFTSGGLKTVFRAAGTKLQAVDVGTPTFTAVSTDVAAPVSNLFSSSTTQSVNFEQFNNGSSNILWAAGGGLTIPVGAYSGTKATQNGVTAPAGAITATVNTHNGGTFVAPGTFWYAIVYRKASTQAFSNASLDKSAVVVNTDDTVTINLSGLTGLDTTNIDQIWIYRSAINGVTAFTAGDLIAQLASSATSYVDTGSSVLTVQTVPRANSTVLDNSPLPAGTYNAITLFKRRLVVASGNTLYFSDVNKSESFPGTNSIVVPSAGNITALATISYTSTQSQALDEFLVVFKERELYVVQGTAYTDWALKYIDDVGCSNQSLVTAANGFLFWVDFRGIYLWDGTSKPIYCSRLIEPLFGRDGDLDKTKFYLGYGQFFRRENQIIWYLSSKTFGEQKYAIKIDLRLSLPMVETSMTGRNIDAVFVQDSYSVPVYAAISYIPAGGSNEQMILGDNAGFCYYAASGYADGTSNYSMTYKTKPLDCGDPNTQKQFLQVIAWVEDIGTWNLYLDYWSNYKTDTGSMSTMGVPISTEDFSGTALYDVGSYDLSYWDSYTTNLVPVLFNLQPGNANSNQGTALQVQFRNDLANQPVVIHGFSVVYQALGGIAA